MTNFIDTVLVRMLVATQFPQWKDFQVRPVAHGGWDNRTFHLGNQLLVRMPSAPEYAEKVAIEHRWLPILAPLLPLQIPQPLVIGQPGNGYPWNWSVYRWLEGESAAYATITNLPEFAKQLGQFLIALQRIDPTHGPAPGLHTSRGGPLVVYDAEAKQAIKMLKDKIDTNTVTEIWETALATSWQRSPVWVHGDISLGNLLVESGQLSAVIDFGGLAVGDPACDLAITWTFLKDESREVFRTMLDLDEGTWERGRGWALWKALIIASGLSETNAIEGAHCWQIIDEIIADHKHKA